MQRTLNLLCLAVLLLGVAQSIEQESLVSIATNEAALKDKLMKPVNSEISVEQTQVLQGDEDATRQKKMHLLQIKNMLQDNPQTAVDDSGLYDGPHLDTYSAGCADDCQDYATLEEAVEACSAIPTECLAITFSEYGSGGSKSTGATNGTWGYQLRASDETLPSPSGEITWIYDPIAVPSGDCVIIFSECNYKGDNETLCDNTAQLTVETRSVYVPQGVTLHLYEHADYEGEQAVLKESVACIDLLHYQLLQKLRIKVYDKENKVQKKGSFKSQNHCSASISRNEHKSQSQHLKRNHIEK